MKNIFKLLLSSFLIVSLFAQNTTGTIEIDDPQQAPPKPPTQVAESKGIEYLTALDQVIESGKIQAIPNLVDSQTQYLSALYLYCSIKDGVCPEVLDVILTQDIINSVNAKKAECPNLKAFWKSWIANDMEKRHSYKVKMAYANQTASFKKDVRPQYVKCTETVEKGMADPFARKAAVKKILALATEIKAKGFDIFANLGL